MKALGLMMWSVSVGFDNEFEVNFLNLQDLFLEKLHELAGACESLRVEAKTIACKPLVASSFCAETKAALATSWGRNR